MHNKDEVTLVDENDQVIGTMDKLEAHRGDGKLHRAISVFLFRKNETGNVELLIQKRSNKKIVGAGQWANTVCGNVWPDESYEDCAKRRLEFELGIETNNLKLKDVTTFHYQVKCNEEFSENEIVHIFVGWFDDSFSLKKNPDEVAETEWVGWPLESLEAIDFAPWFKLFIQDEKVVEKLDEYVK